MNIKNDKKALNETIERLIIIMLDIPVDDLELFNKYDTVIKDIKKKLKAAD